MNIPMNISDGLIVMSFVNSNSTRTHIPKNRQVRYTGTNGYPIEHENLPFVIGDILTIEEIYVEAYSSKVEFQEFPELKFNTVMFEDVTNE